MHETIALTIKLYALLTPPVVLSAFINYTRQRSEKERFYIACKTSLAIFVIGELLFFFGAHIFEIFGFTLDAFRIGVGILLFISAIQLMNDDERTHAIYDHADISVVPLAIPIGMGPSTIGTVMVLGASAGGAHDFAIGSSSIFLASLGMAILLWLAHPLERLFGKTGIKIMAKITALLLSAIAAQVIFTGIKSFLRQINL